MPELPEVETIRRGLERYLTGHSIERVELRLEKLLTGEIDNIISAEVTGVKRFGKGLVIELNNGYSLAIHIKMTGQLIYSAPETGNISEEKVGTLPNKFTHIIFHLSDNANLYYNDVRRFGWVRIIKTDQVKLMKFFSGLGPEPLKDLTLQQFQSILSSSKSSVKILIMDQKKISGIGNIYANDALYLSGILPSRPGNSLLPEEQKALFGAIEEVLKNGLKYGGSSEWTYVNALGQEGSYQKHFLVYGRQGEVCGRCGAGVAKAVIGGRGTYYCPGCQK